MEMMKSDPVFEELFLSFDNFESSCEESDAGQTKDSEPKTSSNPNSTSSGDDECANEALGALLLLANSPVRPMVQTSGSLETPQKSNTSTALNSPLIACTNSVPVVLSPGGLSPMKRPSKPIMSHVRQLNFVGTGKTAGNGNTSQGKYSGDNTPTSTIPMDSSNFNVESSKVSEKAIIPDREIFQSNTCEGKSSNVNACECESSQDKSSQNKSSEGKCFEDRSSNGKASEEKNSQGKNFEDQVFKEDDLSRVDLTCVDSKDPQVEEGTLKNNLNKMKEKGEIGQEKGVGNNPVDRQSGEEKSENRSDGYRCENDNAVGDITCCSDETDTRGNSTADINMPDTETRSGMERTTCFKDSPLKLSVLEDLATNELLQSKTVKPTAETKRTPFNPLKNQNGVTTGSLVKNVNEERCNRTIDVMLCEPTEAKDISSEPNDTSKEVCEGLTSLTDGFVSYIGSFTNIKTPESSTTPGNDLSSSAESDKTTKRKLKKKKKSTRASKKAKIIPEDLDVDKFLSSLHYVQDEKT